MLCHLWPEFGDCVSVATQTQLRVQPLFSDVLNFADVKQYKQYVQASPFRSLPHCDPLSSKADKKIQTKPIPPPGYQSHSRNEQS